MISAASRDNAARGTIATDDDAHSRGREPRTPLAVYRRCAWRCFRLMLRAARCSLLSRLGTSAPYAISKRPWFSVSAKRVNIAALGSPHEHGNICRSNSAVVARTLVVPHLDIVRPLHPVSRMPGRRGQTGSADMVPARENWRRSGGGMVVSTAIASQQPPCVWWVMC